MLGKLWNILKPGFRTRLIIACVVVMSATFFDVFMHPMMKLIWIIVFLFSAELFTAFYVQKFLLRLRLILDHRKATQVDVPLEIAGLADRMGVKLKEFRIREKLFNAYVIGKTIVLGRDLLDRLSREECLAVVAHELGHIKEKHGLIQALLLVPSLMSVISWFDLPPAVFSIAFSAYIVIVMIPVSWTLETRADRIAARFTGKENITSALHVLAHKQKADESSEDHPSIEKRIRLIENLKQ